MTQTMDVYVEPARTVEAISAEDALAAALRGEACTAVGRHLRALLPAGRWRREADITDLQLVARCAGTTVDVGCGPGRMTRALMAAGQVALGVDVVAEAVRQTRTRGAAAIQRDVFDRLPGEGLWDSALLADGNIGIGGDPHRLLRRLSQVVRPGGRVVVDLAPPGSKATVQRVRLEVAGRVSPAFPWAFVPADQIGVIAATVSMQVLELTDVGGRWIAALTTDTAARERS